MKRAVSVKTEKILRKVLDYIEQEPSRLEMGQWGYILPDDVKEVDGVGGNPQPSPPCGTIACLAGTCLLVTKAGNDFLQEHGAFKERGQTDWVSFPDETPEKAAEILGLSEDRAKKLFFFQKWDHLDEKGNPVGWQKEFSDRYEKATTPRGRFLATKARVEHFIATGK